MTNQPVDELFQNAPPIVKLAVVQLLMFADQIDYMGYDNDYFQEDLPRIVIEAIRSWRADSYTPWSYIHKGEQLTKADVETILRYTLKPEAIEEWWTSPVHPSLKETFADWWDQGKRERVMAIVVRYLDPSYA